MYDNKVLEKIIKAILQVITPDKIILFGSRARGDAQEDSDYDLLVIKSGIDNRREIAQDIYVKLVEVNASVDVIVETQENIEKYRDTIGSIIKPALKDGIVVYG